MIFDNQQYTIRKANENDYVFLAESIIGADLGIGGKNSSYASLLGVSNEVARNSIAAMMHEEVDACEFTPTTFLIAEYNKQPVACVSSWVEGAEGMSSWMIRAALIREYYPRGAWEHIMQLSNYTEKIMAHRTTGTLQIESVFVVPEHRGNGIAKELICKHIQNAIDNKSIANIAELMAYKDNKHAINTYLKMGFSIVNETNCTDINALNYFPCTSMALLQGNFKNIIKNK